MLNPEFVQRFSKLTFPPLFGQPPAPTPPEKRPRAKKNKVPQDCKYMHKDLVQCLATYRDCSTDQCEMCDELQRKYDLCLTTVYK